MLQEYDYEFAEFIYYTPGLLDKGGGLWPVRAGRSQAKSNYKVGPKRIECYSLHFVHEGRIRFEYEGKCMDLQQGDMFCLFPGRTYFYCRLPSDAAPRMSWLALDGDRVKPLLELAGMTPSNPFLQQAVSTPVKDTVGRVIDVLADAERWQAAVALKLQGLVFALLSELVPEGVVLPATEPSGWVHDCMEFMQLHATEGISVQQVADFAGVHRSYLSNIFASQVGVPPFKYIQKIRMEKARRLLQETEATVTEIALSVGYPNLYSFTRAFKMYYNVSPISIRKAKRG